MGVLAPPQRCVARVRYHVADVLLGTANIDEQGVSVHQIGQSLRFDVGLPKGIADQVPVKLKHYVHHSCDLCWGHPPVKLYVSAGIGVCPRPIQRWADKPSSGLGCAGLGCLSRYRIKY